MTPHRLGWGFAFNFPFALIVGVVTLASVFFSKEKLRFFWPLVIGWLLFFNVWMLLTTIFSLQPEDSWVQWEKVFKIQLMIFLALWVMGDKERIHSLMWVIVVSIGFYGVKGGIFKRIWSHLGSSLVLRYHFSVLLTTRLTVAQHLPLIRTISAAKSNL